MLDKSYAILQSNSKKTFDSQKNLLKIQRLTVDYRYVLKKINYWYCIGMAFDAIILLQLMRA